MTLAEYLALNPTGSVAQYLDTKDQRVLGKGVGGGARPNFSRAIPLQQDQRFIDNVNAMPKNPPPMVPVPPASNFPRENVVPRVANQNDNPFTGGLTQNGMPLNEMTGRVIPGGEYPIPRPPQPITNQLPPSPMPRGAGVDQAIMANRQPPQLPPPRRTPSKWDLMKEGMFAGEDQRGLFGKAGGDRGSMGLSGFFGDLFNNPNRMAMLSGGLTALDPGSYYDKEGFQSPWTGLRSGLGGAQAGYKSVIDRRKAEADTALAKAKTAAEGQSSQKFKSAQIGDATFMYSDADIQKRRNELMAGGKIGWREATNKAIMETGTRIEKGIAPKSMYDIRVNFDKGQSHLENIDNLLNMAEDSFNTGAVGFGKRGYDKFRGFFSMEGDTTEATQLVTGINRIISQNWKELVGGGQLTPRDIEFIKSVVKTPESLGTTAAEVRASLTELRKILKKAQTNRAKTLGIKDYDPTQRISPNLGSVGGTAKSFIDSISPPR